MTRPEDYPYDPLARVEHLEGPEKLRAIEDRSTAAVMAELYDRTRGRRASLLVAPSAQGTDLRVIRAILEAASAGDYGPIARGQAMLVPRDRTDSDLHTYYAAWQAAGYGKKK